MFFCKNTIYRKIISAVVVVFFSITTIGIPSPIYAQTAVNLPVAGTIIAPTTSFHPIIMKGLIVHPRNPFLFDFIIHPGDSGLKGDELRDETNKLIKYFLAALTTPEDQMWVNLSPYEKNRIVPEKFGQTQMGQDLLAQDYLLKQLTASLMYPETALGQTFWNRVRAKA